LRLLISLNKLFLYVSWVSWINKELFVVFRELNVNFFFRGIATFTQLSYSYLSYFFSLITIAVLANLVFHSFVEASLFAKCKVVKYIVLLALF
jgi:hypothetical protein